ncbi:hypothetical protein DFS33DRAFT_1371242 [Desarmillaria ectypa]|nr:hypothetical protein DFS33DRAFT_1371242 [Desarmillaria ectypa]
MRAPWKLRSSSPYPIYERSLGLNELHFYLRGRVLCGATDSAHSVCFEVSNDEISLITEETVSKAWVFAKQMHPLLGAQVETIGDRDEDILDDYHLVRLFVFRQSDQENCFHIIFHAAHCVSDGVSRHTVVRTLLDFLSSSSPPVPAPHLLEKLALSLAADDLYPIRRLNIATQRWHKAMAHVIASIRFGKLNSGGQTLPGNFTIHMNEKSADSRKTVLHFTAEETLRILKICRDYGFGFGSVYVVLGQIAMGRLLCRRYAQGLMTKEEWEFRKREPTYTTGPVNVRPYLDREWHTHGGAENPILSIGLYVYPMCRIMKKCVDDFLNHPLFLDIGSARYLPPHDKDEGLSIPAIDQAKLGVVPSFGGSSFGSVDKLLPHEFSDPVSGKTPRIHLRCSGLRLRCCPRELYLGALTFRNELELVVYWDNNVTDKAIIEEWLQEVKNTASYYLLKGDREVKP